MHSPQEAHEAAPLVLPGNGPVGWMAVAPAGRLAAARDDGTLSVWNDKGDPVPWHASVGAVCSLAFSSKGSQSNDWHRRDQQAVEISMVLALLHAQA
ncbi:MAG: hypothetical protein ACYCW6_12630 [Candidatus Xenobia bacterium]